jgi:hypothetical protein
MSDNGWQYSTEGDLDPDLTEEAGYLGWEPSDRHWWPVALRVGALILLVALISGALVFSIR